MVTNAATTSVRTVHTAMTTALRGRDLIGGGSMLFESFSSGRDRLGAGLVLPR
jgi:hypothetical protein